MKAKTEEIEAGKKQLEVWWVLASKNKGIKKAGRMVLGGRFVDHGCSHPFMSRSKSHPRHLGAPNGLFLCAPTFLENQNRL